MNPLPDRGYYIAISQEGKMFTLRQCAAFSGSDCHIQNLSHVWEEAEAKAKAVTGFDLEAPEMKLKDLKVHETIDTALMPWGKYKGLNINDIAMDDLRYLVWMVTNNEERLAEDPSHKTDRTIKLIAELPDVINYRKEQIRLKAEREAKWAAEREEMLKTSKHLGTIGERIEFTGTIVFEKSFETEYGIGCMSKVHTDDGCEIMYWNTFNLDVTSVGFTDHKIESHKGDHVTFFAAVKVHSEYNGIKQTVVKRATRAKLLAAGKDNLEYINRYK